MAATFCFSFCLDCPNQQSLYLKTHLLKPHQTLSFAPTSPKPSHPLLLLHKFNRCNFTPSFSSSHSKSYLNHDPLRSNGFVTTQELDNPQILKNFRYFHELKSGSLCIRVMEAEEIDITAGLLAEPEHFDESMGLAFRYLYQLEVLGTKRYLIERRALMPHVAILIGFYRGESGDEELAGTVVVAFNKKGFDPNTPCPIPPKDSPYVSDMRVKKQLRRRGIGSHLLKACEELISQMHNTSREVYLHCRMADTTPFNMYTKAGYNVIKTDSLLILLTLQRRKHLMCKTLPVYNNPSESEILSSEDDAAHESPQ